MPTEKENLYCKEIDQVQNKLSDGCITAHPGFDAICVTEYVLETAYLTFRQHHGPLPEDQNKRNRFIAYRQFVRWCWGWLGRHVRVIIPACAVSSIRNTFPAADGQFEFD
ncbi:uncharacterized protein [Argopecten irradians]|uniref:uncharacterized protein n=1 Tax=Argopecten irradians TaxID=31199 RepID=UPI00371FA255